MVRAHVVLGNGAEEMKGDAVDGPRDLEGLHLLILVDGRRHEAPQPDGKGARRGRRSMAAEKRG